MIELNLLPGRESQGHPSSPMASGRLIPSWPKVDRGLLVALVAVIGLGVRVTMHQMWAPGAIEVLNTALVSAEREAAEILARRSAEDDLMMERDALVGKIDTLERLAEDRLRWPLLWLEIAEAIPPDASLMGLEEISMSPAFRLRLHGVALHHEAIRAFIEQLERLASIREVRLIQTEASVIAEGGVTGAHHFELEVLG